MLDWIGLAVGGTFTAAVFIAVIYLNIRGQRPTLVFRWSGQARVRLAWDPPVTLEAMQRAVDWWIARGAPLSPVVLEGGSPVPVDGEIVVTWRDGQMDAHHAGQTRRTVSGSTGNIICATILVPANPSDIVLAHELGHAIGFEHVSGRHVLAPVTSRMTLNDRGLADALRGPAKS